MAVLEMSGGGCEGCLSLVGIAWLETRKSRSQQKN